jgi:hypothetical protein
MRQGGAGLKTTKEQVGHLITNLVRQDHDTDLGMEAYQTGDQHKDACIELG